MTGALVAVAAVVIIVLLLLSASIRVAREYERGVVFRLGRLLLPPKGPGLFFLIPVVDKMVRVDLRTVTLNIPPQEVITKDNVPVRVNAVAYFRIIEPTNAIVQIENFMVATSQIAQTTLRSVLGQHVLEGTPIAVQLRFLQTMREVASERNTTTFFPVPIDLFGPFLNAMQRPPAP